MTDKTPSSGPGETRDALIRRRQRSRSLVMALLLGALVILIFAISIAKIRLGMA